MLHMPLDDNNKPIPALRYKPGANVNQAVTTGADSVIVIPAGAKMISIWAAGPVKLEFGDASVEADADSHALPGGTLEYVNLADPDGNLYTHVAVIAFGADTTFHLSVRQ